MKKKGTSEICLFFKIVAPHFCTVFSTICGTVVKNKLALVFDVKVFGTPWTILRLRGIEIRVRHV